jgi:Tol biopolymer transport system component
MLLFIETAVHAKIIFSSERDGEIGKQSGGVRGIYVMDDDGSNLTLLIEDKRLKPGSPRWSPNDKQIAFTKRPHRNSSSALFLMNADGTHIRQLTENDKIYTVLGGSFSLDGKSIVFSKDIVVNGKVKNTVIVMDIVTRNMKIIAEVDAVNCEWSLDGKQIVFDKPSTVGGGGNTIWIMGADGHNPRPLIPAPVGGKFFTHRLKPRWSPDGKQIAFLQREYTWHRALIYHAHRYIICDRNGDNIRKLRIPKDFDATSLDWMDDGKSIVFTARAGMPLDEPIPQNFLWPPSYVYKYHIRTGEITQLTNDPWWDQTIDWISDDVLSVTPEGKKQMQWGTIKKILQKRSDVFKSLPHSM